MIHSFTGSVPAPHRIVFVTGKGGVGKSAVAAATALQLARAGQRVLLVELGSRSFYGPWLGLAVGAEPVAWQPRVALACWDVASALHEYVAHYLVFKSAARGVLGNAVMKALVAAAPSVAELAILGKLTAPIRHRWYRRDAEVVVVDGYSTGQFLALLRAPRGLALTVSSGTMHRHTQAMAAVLADPATCSYRIVTVAEETPVAEAAELAAAIRAETGIAPGIVVNRWLELPRLPPAPAGDDAAAPFLRHLARVSARQRSALAALRTAADDRAGPPLRLPFVATTEPVRLLDALAGALATAPEAGA